MNSSAPSNGTGPNANGSANQTANPDEWDEARLEEGLKRLKLLHIKARTLRQAIPKITEPLESLETKQSSPDITFQNFVASVNEVKANVHAFTELINDGESKAVLERAEKSRAERPTGIKPWKYQDHSDWFDLDDSTK